MAVSELDGRVNMAESEWYDRVNMTESEWYLAESPWPNPNGLAESEWPNPMPWLLQSEISYTIGISWSLVRQIPRHMPGRRQSRLDHAWG